MFAFLPALIDFFRFLRFVIVVFRPQFALQDVCPSVCVWSDVDVVDQRDGLRLDGWVVVIFGLLCRMSIQSTASRLLVGPSGSLLSVLLMAN